MQFGIKMETAPAIGIDLGTTNSCVAVMRYGKVEVIANEQGNFVTPSYVAFTPHEILIGDAAKNQISLNPENTVFDAKRMIGKDFDDPTIQSGINHWPFVVKSVNSQPRIEVTYKGARKEFAPEEISAMILGYLKDVAESYLNQEIKNAVITVPAYFNNAQREATINAGNIAGLNVLAIINEPTAAAISFTYNNENYWTQDLNVLVFDLGGGTFDTSIVKAGAGNEMIVQATSGDTHLGGEDFDCNLVDFCVEDFNRKHKRDIKHNFRALRRLRTACERAKRELSSVTQTDIIVDALVDGINYTTTITRARFENLNKALLEKPLESVQKALDDGQFAKEAISKIVLVGGSTRIPKVQKLLQDFFNGKELERTINPDEAVALGAAILAAILHGDKSENIFGRVLQDVTPISLGILVKGNNMDTLIPRNTSIPTCKTKYFTTSIDNQERVPFRVFQGENPDALQNVFLGQFELTGFNIAPKGVPRFAVTFKLNTNGILTATATDGYTGTTNSIKIQNISAVFKNQQVEKMIQDNERYRTEYKTRKQAQKSKNILENTCFDIQSELQQNGEISQSEKEQVFKKCEETLAWADENPHETKEVYEVRHSEIANAVKDFFGKFKSIFSTD